MLALEGRQTCPIRSSTHTHKQQLLVQKKVKRLSVILLHLCLRIRTRTELRLSRSITNTRISLLTLSYMLRRMTCTISNVTNTKLNYLDMLINNFSQIISTAETIDEKVFERMTKCIQHENTRHTMIRR